MKRGKTPYEFLGRELLRIRTRIQESMAEVSGAVEISDEQLKSYEKGETRPSEDIMQLMITHFNLKDEESDKLWDMAGYDDIKEMPSFDHHDAPGYTQQPAVMLLPIDARIVYSDSYQVSINQYGVVMNFLQSAGTNNQQVPIARIGMSLDHAKRIVDTLQQTIKTATEMRQPKNLPSSKKDNNIDTKD